MAKIDQAYINQLLSRINIVDLIQGRIKLKKAGKDYQACCPFHQEKTPSFTVSDAKQFYHCFGCGEHGTALTFLMKYDGLTFIEALELLAQKTGMPMPQKSHTKEKKFTLDPYDILEQCCQYFSQQIPASQQAKDYIEERKLLPKTIENFRIGYAKNSWDGLMHHFTDSQKIDMLAQLDMVIDRRQEGQGKRYDRFRHRLMFPIIDRRGRPIAFGARVLDPNDQPKYLNNAETAIFQKRREIYGLYQCLQAARNPDYLIVTEGYMDVIALHQAGIPHAVASMGTSLTIEQITQLSRFSKRLIICFDGDHAGQEAAQRSLKTILPSLREEWDIQFLLLPGGVDPDNYIQQYGKQRFLERLKKSHGIIEFIKWCIAQQGDKDNPEHKPRLVKSAKQWIKLIAQNSWQPILIDSLSDYLQIDAQYLLEMELTSPQPPNTETPWQARSSRYSPSLKLAERFIIYVLAYPESIHHLDSTEINELATLSPLINQLIQVIRSSNLEQVSMGALIENWHGTSDYETLKRFLIWHTPLTQEQITQEIKQMVQILQKQTQKKEWNALQQKMKLYGESGLTEEEKKRYLELIYQR